jgi:hypothetical protein
MAKEVKRANHPLKPQKSKRVQKKNGGVIGRLNNEYGWTNHTGSEDMRLGRNNVVKNYTHHKESLSPAASPINAYELALRGQRYPSSKIGDYSMSFNDRKKLFSNDANTPIRQNPFNPNVSKRRIFKDADWIKTEDNNSGQARLRNTSMPLWGGILYRHIVPKKKVTKKPTTPPKKKVTKKPIVPSKKKVTKKPIVPPKKKVTKK